MTIYSQDEDYPQFIFLNNMAIFTRLEMGGKNAVSLSQASKLFFHKNVSATTP
jgi:hypothetical protein